MTWVIGGKHLFCARCISDVEVTINHLDGRKEYYPAVKKVHEIGPGIIVCFADSIKLGFSIIEGLKNDFYPNLDSRLFQEPNEIIRQMLRYIKRNYEETKDELNKNVELLIMISPTGLYKEFGVYKLKSPNFTIIERQQPFEMLEIGSGSVIEDYREAVNKNSVGVYTVEDEDGGKPFAVIPIGKVAMQYIFAEALEYQNAGISKAMHITLLSHEETYIQELPEKPGERFPRVASTWVELQRFMKAKGILLASCYASA